MSVPSVLREDHGPIAVLTLNRPERRNALSLRLVSELSDILTRVASEPGVRVGDPDRRRPDVLLRHGPEGGRGGRSGRRG